MGNRETCRGIAKQFHIPWFNVASANGDPDNDRMVELWDKHEIDYVILARYMRVLPAASCWKYAGGRIINLHHGLLPSFPGMQPWKRSSAASSVRSLLCRSMPGCSWMKSISIWRLH